MSSDYNTIQLDYLTCYSGDRIPDFDSLRDILQSLQDRIAYLEDRVEQLEGAKTQNFNENGQ